MITFLFVQFPEDTNDQMKDTNELTVNIWITNQQMEETKDQILGTG